MQRFYNREPFASHLWSALPMLVVMTVLGVALQRYGLYGPLERLVIDTFAATEPRQPANHTFIFDIDDESYAKSFDRTSPLNQEKLLELILAAIKARARVVTVDVDTDVAALRRKIGDTVTRVVWARAPEPCPGTVCVLLPKNPPPPTQPGDPTLADVEPPPLEGLALLPLDTDGIVRRYRPMFEIATEDNTPAGCSCPGSGTLVPSLPRAAVLAARFEGTSYTKESLLLNWNGDRYTVPRIPAHRVLAGWEQKWWGEAQPVAGRIVLIGGTFREARDVRSTPAGPMTGVEIMAHMIEAEMNRGGLVEFGFWAALQLDALVSIALVWINWRYPAETRTGFALNALVVLALPFAASWLLHRYALYWINMGPVLAGVWISQWHERAKVLAGRR